MENLAHAVERLTRAGYRDDFRAEPAGLRAVNEGRTYEPESLIVDEVVRFEGESDPGDEVVLYALRAGTSGIRGTYVVAYGASVAPHDAEMSKRLHHDPETGARKIRQPSR